MLVYLILMVPPLLLALWAQYKVKSNFQRYSEVLNSSGMTGAQAAAEMCERMGLRVVGSSAEAKRLRDAVAIEITEGFLSDHYDPSDRTLRLSPDVYNGRSLSAVGVACHEAGHALQHAHGYAALQLRSTLVPTASFGSWLAFPILMAGVIMQASGLLLAGIILFSMVVLFQLVTLPVEFDASARAKDSLEKFNIIRGGSERDGVAAVLNAAALTYVAAAVSAVSTLLYYLYLYFMASQSNE